MTAFSSSALGGLGSCLAFGLSQSVPPIRFEITDTNPARAGLVERATSYAVAVSEPQGEYDVVFDVSGSESGLRLACRCTRPGGTLCMMSHLDGYSSGEFLLAALTRRDITFTVSYLNGPRETLEVAASMLARSWSTDWDPIVETVAIDRLQDAFTTRRDAAWCKTLIDVGAS